ncbi:hypothetical protein ZWY2020_008867 [Hordeum vulgare]|nr:hypothetical protein ZWY2020_008867 [Hordeum vulgare]
MRVASIAARPRSVSSRHRAATPSAVLDIGVRVCSLGQDAPRKRRMERCGVDDDSADEGIGSNIALGAEAGLDKCLRFFQIDCKRNPKIQSIFVEDCPVHKASFLPDGSEVIQSGRRKFFYSFDLVKAAVSKTGPLNGRDEKSLENFEISPDSKTIAFVSNEGAAGRRAPLPSTATYLPVPAPVPDETSRTACPIAIDHYQCRVPVPDDRATESRAGVAAIHVVPKASSSTRPRAKFPLPAPSDRRGPGAPPAARSPRPAPPRYAFRDRRVLSQKCLFPPVHSSCSFLSSRYISISTLHHASGVLDESGTDCGIYHGFTVRLYTCIAIVDFTAGCIISSMIGFQGTPSSCQCRVRTARRLFFMV